MSNALSSVARTVIRVLASRQFFVAVMVFFVLEALWFVVSAAYPMAFDEEYHLGVTKLFSDHLLPFLSSQPESADSFGAIIRDPSYLYHYLLAFPYRLLHAVTDNQTVIVIVLRLINVALVAWSLVLFRKVLLRAKTSPALTHTALAVFVLIPIVPQLAAHLNYDNLLLPLTAWLCLLVADVLDGLKTRSVEISTLATLLIVCMAMSLVKYESLPFVAAAVLFVGFMLWQTLRGNGWKKIAASAKKLSRRTAIILAGVSVVLLGLVVQKYGMNVWQYQALKPDCEDVLSMERCEAFGPWARNERLEKVKGDVDANPLAYTWTWLQGLHYRLFFAVSGKENHYVNYPPLPLPAAAAVALAVSGLIALLLYWRKVFAGHPFLVFLCFMSMLYLGALWFENYSQYLETGQPVAINGRYLLPILLPLAAVLGRALSIALLDKVKLKAATAVVVIVLFLEGGGVFTFIARSDASWYWPNNTIIDMNHGAQKILKPILIEGPKTY